MNSSRTPARGHIELLNEILVKAFVIQIVKKRFGGVLNFHKNHSLTKKSKLK